MTDVIIKKKNNITVITLNRPEVKNAMTSVMYFAVADALDEASRDVDVRAVVITGAGDAFCSGADTRPMVNRTGMFEGSSAPTTRHSYTHGVQRLSNALYACETPTIAAVNGPAVGLGFDV